MTQADLWNQYEGSTIINGDRSVLYRSKNGWVESCSPYAGSSHYYVNKSLPIRAIVMLEQGKECLISQLNAAEAFRRLYAETTINTWNECFINGVCDLLTDLAVSVPIYHLSCTPDKNAVDVLKKRISDIF